ncbi:MAG: hypothetical protein ABGY11_15450 [Candidatus Thioglobus sp.]
MNSIMLKILIVSWFALFPIAAYMEGFNIWSFLIGAVFIAIPALIIAWSERGAEANRIAYRLSIDVLDLLYKEDSEYPIENERFRVEIDDSNPAENSYKVYSKQYDINLLIGGNNYPGEFKESYCISWYCDQNFKTLALIQIPHKFNLKKYLIKGL